MGTYLLTGTAGFIGARVAALLLSQGHTVIGLDNLNEAYDVRLKHWRLAQLTSQRGFTFQQADICDRAALEAGWAGQRFDAVINLAARAGVRYSVENPWVYQDTNIIGNLNLLEMCRAHGVPKFVLASSSSLYGAHTPLPFREDANTDHPLSPYAASKKAAEVMCYTYHHLHQLDVTVLRFFTVFGPAGRPDMSPLRFVQWISEGRPVTLYGDGQQSRDFTYVDDIARGTIAGLKPLGYEIINLGSDQPLTMLDAIRVMEEVLGRPAHMVWKPAHRADMAATWADVSKAGRLLGWEARTDFRGGIEQLARWYHDNRAWAKDIRTE